MKELKEFEDYSIIDGKLSFSSNVEVIPAYAFQSNKRIQRIAFPKSLKRIEYSAFYDCTKLKEVKIPDGVTYIGGAAFAFCILLHSIKLPNKLKVINPYTFAYTNISSLDLPDTVEVIGDAAFANLTIPMQEVKCNDNLRIIGSGAFDNGAKTVKLPMRLEYLAAHKYDSTIESSYCDKFLNENIIDRNMAELRHLEYGSSFTDCYMIIDDTLYISGGIEVLDKMSYIEGADKIKRIAFPDTLLYITSDCFKGYTSLEKIEFPQNLKYVGTQAFDGAANVKRITIPASLRFLGSSILGIDNKHLLNSDYLGYTEVPEDCSFLEPVFSPVKYDMENTSSLFSSIVEESSNRLKELGYDEEVREEYKSKIKVVSEQNRKDLTESMYYTIMDKKDIEYEYSTYTFLLSLVLKGAEIDKPSYPNPFGDSIMDLLIMQRKKAYIKLLIDAGFDFNKYLDSTSICKIAEYGLDDLMELIILLGFNINVVDEEGNTPLSYAVQNGDFTLTNLLVSNGANVNHLLKNGKTILDLAREINNSMVTNLLMANYKGVSSNTESDISILESLLNSGSIEKINKSNNNPKSNIEREVDEIDSMARLNLVRRMS